jgi:hypothetical protein
MPPKKKAGAVTTAEGRLSIARCRELLGDDFPSATDVEVAEIRDTLYAVAGVVVRSKRPASSRKVGSA